jgi:hypothetical protein
MFGRRPVLWGQVNPNPYRSTATPRFAIAFSKLNRRYSFVAHQTAPMLRVVAEQSIGPLTCTFAFT